MERISRIKKKLTGMKGIKGIKFFKNPCRSPSSLLIPLVFSA
jgi:hypothetical protein